MKVKITVYNLEVYEICPDVPPERVREIQRTLALLGLKVSEFTTRVTELELP